MKKVFLTLTMLLFAFMGTMRADEVTIGNLEDAANNSYLPMNSLYEYSFTEQIYTAEEIGTAGTINSITMWMYGNENLYTMPFDIYMVEVDKDAFEGTSDWVAVTASNIVYSGEVTVHNTEAEAYTFTLATPFNYSGNGNLVIAFNNNTGQWKSGLNGKVFGAASDPSRAIYARRDSTPYDIANLPAATAVTYQRNVVTLDISGGGEPATLTVYDGTTTSNYVPMYVYYFDDFTRSQHIIPAADLADMSGGTINAITYYTTNSNIPYTTVSTVEFYLTEVGYTTISEYVDKSTAQVVYTGTVDFVAEGDGGIAVITFATPYHYNGGNLLVGCENTTDAGWKNINFYGENVTGASIAGSDGSSTAAAPATQRNFIPKTTFDYTTGGGPTPPPPVIVADLITDPEELNLGYRPVGYWMEPYTFKFFSQDANVNINQVINGSNAFMTVNLETPVLVELDGEGVEATITTGNAAAGNITEQFAVDFNGTRALKTFGMSAVAYEPVEGDVFEIAQEVTIPFTGNAPSDIYKNYNLKDADPNAADAIYKFTLDEAVLLTAGTNGANGVAKLYTEDFNGEPGPMENNYYEYEAGGGGLEPVDAWFSYPYTGSNTFFGTSAGGGFLYGYRIPAEFLAGFGHCYLTEVEAAARESYPYNLYVLRGGETPGEAELVYYQEMTENPEQLSFFDMGINTPFTIGETEDVWVLFYSESPYAAYCGKQAEDPENAKIWYSVDGTTWYDNETYTPVIYVHLEYPNPVDRGEVVLNLADMSIKPINGEGTLSEAKGNVTLPVHPTMRSRTDQISNMFVPAGTYYLAVASTDENFEVHITTSGVPAPEQATIIAPADGEQGVGNGYVMQWELGNYTEEFQIVMGTQFPPTNVLVDWTNNLTQAMNLTGLQNNKTYFVQINARNSAGTTMGNITGFTTTIDGVNGFAAESENLYPGEDAVFTWEANGRSLQGYNLYQDGVKVNEEPIVENTYSVADLAYNMDGYSFQLTAVYDEGESELSNPVMVYMTGYATVSGTVFEQDGETVVAGASVELRGTDEYGVLQGFVTTTDEEGAYTVEVLAGIGYRAYAYKDGYQESPGADFFNIAYQDVYENIDILLYESYDPLGQITATLQEDDNNVLVEWDWAPAEMFVDFETGDFSQAEFVLPTQYPWAITTTNPYEGTYCMKSTCEGIASASSSIEAIVDVPFEAGKMSFWVRTSSESNYDKFHFYIDGVEQGSALSGQNPYAFKEYAVTGGTHTYKWEYTKDSSVNSNDDCIYVDNITMFRQDVPLPPVQGATTYDFEDGTMMGWTSLDADNDGYGWVSSSDPGIYHNAGVSLAGTGHDASQAYVISGSYSNSAGIALNPDNYLIAPTQISAENGAQIQFWACAQDASYAAEHFGVAVSTTTATAAAFTTIQEWTMTAKGPQGRTAEAERDIRGLRQGTWYQYVVDLSSYAGQDIWVAIRHFNCYDMFILNVDDIILADGSAKGAVVDHTRSLQGFNLYRRNNFTDSIAELIASPASSDYSYTDNAWDNLPFGKYQWGIQAVYGGNAGGDRGELTVCDGTSTSSYIPVFGLWMDDYTRSEMIYPAEMLEGMGGGQISSLKYYIGTPASGPWTGNVFNVYLKQVEASTLDSYYTSEGATIVYTGSLDGQGTEMVINFATPFTYNGGNLLVGFEEIECSTYKSCYFYGVEATGASASGYSGSSLAAVTFNQRDFLPKTTFTYSGGGGGPVSGDGLSEITWSNEVEKDLYSHVTVNVSLNNGQTPVGVSVAFDNNTALTDENGTAVFEALPKGTYQLTVSMPDFYDYTDEVVLEENEEVFNVTLIENVGPVADLYVSPTGWAMWNGGSAPTPPTPPTPPTGGQWYQYGTDEVATGVGAGGAFYWGVMFPAGSYTGNMVTKAATYEMSGYSFSGNVTIYNDGTSAPANAVGTMDISVAGATDGWAEFEFATPVNIDPTKNLWIIFYNATSTSYPAAACVDAGDPNARWVSLDGTTWMDLASAGLSGYSWMVKTYVASGAKGEVVEISSPIQTPVNAGVLSMKEMKNHRSALSYKVMLDGQYEGETVYPFFQHDVTGFEAGSEHTTSVAAIYSTGFGEWVSYDWIYDPCDNYAGVNDFNAVQNGTNVNLTWTMPSGPTPPTPPSGGWTEGFESGMPAGWTVVDANNDGWTWCLTSAIPSTWTYYATMTLDWYRTGTNAICSGSYINGVGALNPNEYLITSQVTPSAGSTFSFWAAATDASYPADHFGVAVSTSGTNPSDFVMLDEWTLTAKNGGHNGGRASRDGDGAKLGTWYNYSVDLSSYAGQAIYIAIRHFNCTDQYIMCVDDLEFTTAAKGNRDMWDYVYHFSGSSAGQQGVCTDGNYIYTASWQTTPTGGYTFYKYQMDGTFVEGFDIAGATGIRDLTTDGDYFYGTSGGAQIFILDFNSQTLVGTINCSGLTSRHISYDPERDGFWSGNWSTLALYSRTGALIQNGPAPTSAYGSAYYKDADNVEHLFLFSQPSSDAKVFDYNITTNTLSSSPVFDFAVTPGFDGIAGGCFIGEYNGNTCWFGNSQQDPNLIGIYEIAAGSGPTPPTPPTPGNILGAYVFRNGEVIAQLGADATSYVDAGGADGDEYCVRVVYSDYAMSCPECVTIDYTCYPVTNLQGEHSFTPNSHITLTWENEHHYDGVTYDVYYDGIIQGNTSEMVYVIDLEGREAFTFGVVAVYPNCESEMETVVVQVTGVDEIGQNIAIYPNPTNSNVTIEAMGMRHITVVSSLGQVVYDADVEADMIQLNLGQYQAGLYMVRINSEAGVVVKRVTVVK